MPPLTPALSPRRGEGIFGDPNSQTAIYPCGEDFRPYPPLFPQREIGKIDSGREDFQTVRVSQASRLDRLRKY